MSETQIYKGGYKISKFYLGGYEAKEVYLGGKRIYSRGPEDGAVVTDAVYTYTFSKAMDGWSAVVTNRNSTAAITQPPKVTLQDKYIVSYSNMFNSCLASDITKALQAMDSSHVTDMSAMFLNYGGHIDLGHLDTRNVTSMSDMFALVHLVGYTNKSWIVGLPHLNVNKVQNFSGMFYNTHPMFGLDFSTWHIRSDAVLDAMLADCYPSGGNNYTRTLTELSWLSNVNVTYKPTSWSFQVK